MSPGKTLETSRRRRSLISFVIDLFCSLSCLGKAAPRATAQHLRRRPPRSTPKHRLRALSLAPNNTIDIYSILYALIHIRTPFLRLIDVSCLRSEIILLSPFLSRSQSHATWRRSRALRISHSHIRSGGAVMLACMVISSINRSELFGRRRDDGERNQWKIYLQNCSDENNELREHLQYINSAVSLALSSSLVSAVYSNSQQANDALRSLRTFPAWALSSSLLRIIETIIRKWLWQ